jgi:hypothetical protein
MLITRVLKLDASDAQEPFDLTVTPFDTQLKIQAGSASETFTPLVPSALVSDGAELKLTGAKANGDLVGFALSPKVNCAPYWMLARQMTQQTRISHYLPLQLLR